MHCLQWIKIHSDVCIITIIISSQWQLTVLFGWITRHTKFEQLTVYLHPKLLSIHPVRVKSGKKVRSKDPWRVINKEDIHIYEVRSITYI